MPAEQITTRCCIAGGGPAGMMLGFLLARAGVDVVVLEKHADFLRDFRGDTMHPSTLQVMYELGLLDEFLRLPHQKVAASGRSDRRRRASSIADFTHLPTHCKFIALMPQWDFLDFLAEQGKRYPGFDLRCRRKPTRLDRGGRPGRRPDAPTRRKARSTSAPISSSAPTGGIRRARAGGSQGRRFRRADGCAVVSLAARRRTTRRETLGHIDAGHMFVMLDRGDYWQCAYVIPKGGIAARACGRARRVPRTVGRLSPFLADRVGELTDWDDVKLLTVTVDRLQQWCAAGAAVHRRRRARDVADRRRRHQSRGAGRGRRRQPSRRAAQARHRDG